MKKQIEWATANNDGITVIKQEKQNKFQNLILNPEYRSLKKKFADGITWLRFLPAIAGSKMPWMVEADVYNICGTQFVKPKNDGDNMVMEAWRQLKQEHPEKLYNKQTKLGFKLWPKKTGIAWAIDEDAEEGKRLCLVVASAYDAAFGGVPGLANKILVSANETDSEPGSKTNGEKIHGEITDPQNGKLVKIEQKNGGEYAAYSVAIGKKSHCISNSMDKLTDDESSMIVPLENVIYEPTRDEQITALKQYLGSYFDY